MNVANRICPHCGNPNYVRFLDDNSAYTFKCINCNYYFNEIVSDGIVQRKGEMGMSATIYKWIVVYDDGGTEERYGENPSDFVDYIEKVPVAIIRTGYGLADAL